MAAHEKHLKPRSSSVRSGGVGLRANGFGVPGLGTIPLLAPRSWLWMGHVFAWVARWYPWVIMPLNTWAGAWFSYNCYTFVALPSQYIRSSISGVFGSK